MNVKEHYAVLAGKKLRELRLEQKYTAAEFARLAGIKSEQQLYRYERGMNKITIDTLIFALRTYPKRNCQIIHNDNF